MTLGRQKLQQFFKDRPGLRQEQVAMIIGYSAGFFSRVMTGKQSPPPARFAAKMHAITSIDPTDWYQPAEPENKED